MGPAGPEIKNNCAGGAQQQFTRPIRFTHPRFAWLYGESLRSFNSSEQSSHVYDFFRVIRLTLFSDIGHFDLT
jgi:hypothetical protein